MPILVYANHTHITCVNVFSVESAAMVSEFSVEVMVCGYHIYEDIWDAIIADAPCSAAHLPT